MVAAQPQDVDIGKHKEYNKEQEEPVQPTRAVFDASPNVDPPMLGDTPIAVPGAPPPVPE